jgi:hypothetical protein
LYGFAKNNSVSFIDVHGNFAIAFPALHAFLTNLAMSGLVSIGLWEVGTTAGEAYAEGDPWVAPWNEPWVDPRPDDHSVPLVDPDRYTIEDLLPPPLIDPDKYYPNFVEISVPVPVPLTDVPPRGGNTPKCVFERFGAPYSDIHGNPLEHGGFLCTTCIYKCTDRSKIALFRKSAKFCPFSSPPQVVHKITLVALFVAGDTEY